MALNEDQKLIRRIVDEMQMPQQRLAGLCDLSFAAFHAWLNGMRSPTPQSFSLIADGLDEYSGTVKELAKQARAAAAGRTD